MSSALIQCQIAKVLAWLPRQSPDIWHAVATGWNWDVDLAPLEWIVRQPDCDAATAQFVFWTARLGDSHELADLRSMIAERWSAGEYRTARFSVRDHVRPEPDRHGAGPPGIEIAIDGPEESNVENVLDEGVPRDIVIDCFKECGQPLPAWLQPKDDRKLEFDRLWGLIMDDGIDDESQRRAMWASPLLLEDTGKWRTFVDTEQFNRISAQARVLIKEGKATNDSELGRQGEEISKRAYSYLARMQRPFDVEGYPEYPRPQKRGLTARIFGRKPPTT